MSDSDTIVWPRVKVFARASLVDGDWGEVDYLDCLGVTERTSPGVSEARFVYRAGSMLYQDDDAFTDRDPNDLVGQFIRVQFLAAATADDPSPADTPVRTFIGIVRKDRREVGAKLSDEIAQPVMQTLTAVGIEDELDRITVTGGFMFDRTQEGDDTNATASRAPLVFNEVGRVGLGFIGNRTSGKYTVQTPSVGGVETPLDAYVFEALPRSDGTQSDPWGLGDILEYLIKAFAPDLPITLPFLTAGTGPGITPIKPSRFAPEGMSLKQAIDSLVRPERGLSWGIRPSTAGGSGDSESLELFVFSVNDTDVPLTDGTLAGNTDVVALDASNDPSVTRCVVEQDHSEAYGSVLVLGERLLSCFTLKFDEGKLEKDWTDAEEADYKTLMAALGNSDGSNPAGDTAAAAGLDNLQHVYTRYKLSDEWTGQSSSSGTGSGGLVLPQLLTDGAISSTAASLYRRGVGFEDELPINSPNRPSDDNYKMAGAEYYLRPFVLVQYPPGYSDAGGGGSGSGTNRLYSQIDLIPGMNSLVAYRGESSMTPTKLAVQVHVPEPHVMANSVNWTEIDDGFIDGCTIPAVFSYQEILATIALRTNERLFALRTIADGVSPRQLIIEVPEAQLWIVDPSTVVGLDGSYQPKAYSGSRKIRDDSSRVVDVAAAAAAWYGKTHRGVSVSWAGAVLDYALGQFVGSVALSGETAVNLCIGEIEFDCVRKVTTLSAGQAAPRFGELDRLERYSG